MNVPTSYDGLWRKRLQALSAVWPHFLEGESDALHKTRVASRRIREALPVVGASASSAKVKKLRRKMRELTRSLGPIRELDVELAMIEKEAALQGAPRFALAVVRREVAAQRRALREQLKHDRPVSDLKKLLKRLERVAQVKGKGRRAPDGKIEKRSKHEIAWRAALGAGLMRRARTLNAALEEAGPLYAPDRIHEVRIAIKKLRYALEMADETGYSAIRPLLKLLKREQDRLGRLHDVEMLLNHVRDAETSPRVGSRLADLKNYADGLERDCRRLHAEFVEDHNAMLQCVQVVRRELVPALTAGHLRPAHVAPRQAYPARAVTAERRGR